MSDEFEFTENSAKVATEELLQSAKDAVKTEELKAQGLSPGQIYGKHLEDSPPGEIAAFGKLIRIINLLLQMGKDFYLGELKEQNAFDESVPGEVRLRNNALLGYMALCQRYVDSNPAKKWNAFFDEAEYVGDVYRYFLQENNLTYDEASGIAGYSILDVEEILKIRLDQKETVEFAINKAEWTKRHEASIADIEQMERVKLFVIWREGYSVTGNQSEAELMGDAVGETFRDAVIWFFDHTKKYDKTSFNAERLTYWGCRLFDNEVDARRAFG